MSDAHIVVLPKAVWGLKIAQLALSVLILALSAFVVYYGENTGSDFALFSAAYTIIITTYYFVSLHAAKGLYNWIALLVLECLAVVWWLCAWAISAAVLVLVEGSYCITYSCAAFNDAVDSGGLFGAFFSIWKVTIVLGVLQFIFYCVTLGFMSVGIHRHRMTGKPINAAGVYTSNNAWAAAEKTEMQNMPEIQAYPASPEYVPPKVQQTPAPYGQAQPPVSAYSQGATMQPNAHEVYGSGRY